MSGEPKGGRGGQQAGLRLLENPEQRAPAPPDPELKAVLDDMRRRYRVARERAEREPESPDAA